MGRVKNQCVGSQSASGARKKGDWTSSSFLKTFHLSKAVHSGVLEKTGQSLCRPQMCSWMLENN